MASASYARGDHARTAAPAQSVHRWLALMNQSRMRTLSSTALPRSPAHEPTLPARHTRRWCSEHRGELQAEAVLCCYRGRIRTITAVPHTHATAGGFPEGIQPLPAGHMHPGCVAQRTCGLQAEPIARIGRQEAGLCSNRVSSAGRAFTIRMRSQVLMPSCEHTAGTYQYATSAGLKLHGRVLFGSQASLP